MNLTMRIRTNFRLLWKSFSSLCERVTQVRPAPIYAAYECCIPKPFWLNNVPKKRHYS